MRRLVFVCLVVTLMTWGHSVSAHRVVAIGDIHGDLENAKEILRLAQVVDDEGRWATGTDTVIQVGDICDRGPHAHTIMLMFERLKTEARRAGGELIVLLGNHELMNLNGDAKFANPALVQAFGGLDNWRKEFSSADGAFAKIIERRPTTVYRNGTIFVHAGITKEVASLGTLEELNTRMGDLLRKRAGMDPLLLDGGPVWSRRLIYSAQLGNCEPVANAMSQLRRVEAEAAAREKRSPREFRRMVIGHTIQPNGTMRVFCNDTLYAIDICMSQYMMTGGHLGHLELHETPSGIETTTFVYPPKAQTTHLLTKPRPYLHEADKLSSDLVTLKRVGDQKAPQEPIRVPFGDELVFLRDFAPTFRPTPRPLLLGPFGAVVRSKGALVDAFEAGKKLLRGSSSVKTQHHDDASSTSYMPLMLVCVGVSIVVWRVGQAYSKRSRLARGKKNDV